MSYTTSAHFERGDTAYGFGPIDANNLLFDSILGSVKEFPDINYAQQGSENILTSMIVTCIALRNITGAALLPGDVVQIDSALPAKQVSAKSSAANQWFAVVDEYLPAGGCPNNDICWFVIKGPCKPKAATVSGAQAVGLGVGTSSTAGKIDFTPETAASAIIAQHQAAYGYNAVTLLPVPDTSTSYRIVINRNFWGQ